jgi:DNA-binding response OmpR family regulator
MKILLADDDKNFASILKQELEDESFMVDVVGNGVEAVLNFIAKTYDFLLMDLKMPGLSGIDALKIIKKLKPDTPCITFSGKAGAEERAEAVECGAMSCLQKPFAISKLKEEIRNHIPQKEGALMSS